MHMCIPSHRLKRSIHPCPRQVNASNKNTPSMQQPPRQNVTTSRVGLRNDHIPKNLTQNGEPQRYSWGTLKKKITQACNITLAMLAASINVWPSWKLNPQLCIWLTSKKITQASLDPITVFSLLKTLDCWMSASCTETKPVQYYSECNFLLQQCCQILTVLLLSSSAPDIKMCYCFS